MRAPTHGTPNGPNRQCSGTADVPIVPVNMVVHGAAGVGCEIGETADEGRRGPRAAPDPRLGRAGAPPRRGPAERHPARPRGRGTRSEERRVGKGGVRKGRSRWG